MIDSTANCCAPDGAIHERLQLDSPGLPRAFQNLYDTMTIDRFKLDALGI